MVTKLAPSVTSCDKLVDAVARHVIINIIGEDEKVSISERDNRQLKWWEKLKALADKANTYINGERFSGAVGRTANEYASKLLTSMVTSRTFFKKYLDATTPESQVKIICDEAQAVLSKKEEKPIQEEQKTKGKKESNSP